MNAIAMRHTVYNFLVPCLLLIGTAAPLAAQTAPAQTVAPELAQVSSSVESYFRKKVPDWKHETVPPASPPGVAPSPNVVIHGWSSDKCLSAELKIDGVDYGTKPVPCRINLSIDQSDSTQIARSRLEEFLSHEWGARFEPLAIGDKGYLWGGSSVVFVKGRFTFWFNGNVDLNVGHFSISTEFLERLAKEVADGVGPI